MHVDKWTGCESVSIKEILTVLNDAVACDTEAVSKLIDQRVRCNLKLAAHDTIQVQGDKDNLAATYVGLLGMLNGVIGVDRNVFGPITAIYDDKGVLQRFSLTDTDAVTKSQAIAKDSEDVEKNDD